MEQARVVSFEKIKRNKDKEVLIEKLYSLSGGAVKEIDPEIRAKNIQKHLENKQKL